MKITLTGKVLSRTCYVGTDGQQHYSVIIEEPGKFPSPFKFTTKDPTIFGPTDGFASVGKTVTVSGFINSKMKTFTRANGQQGQVVDMWCTATRVEAAPFADAESRPEDAPIEESDPSEMPF